MPPPPLNGGAECACPMCRLAGGPCRFHRIMMREPLIFARCSPTQELTAGAPSAYTRTYPDRRLKGARATP